MNKMGMYSVRPCGVCGCVVTYFFGEVISGIAYRWQQTDSTSSITERAQGFSLTDVIRILTTTIKLNEINVKQMNSNLGVYQSILSEIKMW